MKARNLRGRAVASLCFFLATGALTLVRPASAEVFPTVGISLGLPAGVNASVGVESSSFLVRASGMYIYRDLNGVQLEVAPTISARERIRLRLGAQIGTNRAKWIDEPILITSYVGIGPTLEWGRFSMTQAIDYQLYRSRESGLGRHSRIGWRMGLGLHFRLPG